jgi:glycosyltransferase involved in cell wall biosynthesis
MTKRRVLIVKPVLPYPPDQGTKVVTMGLIDALAPVHDVTVLARLQDRAEHVHVGGLESRGARVVTVIPANRTSFAARVAYKLGYALRTVFTGRTMKSSYDCPGVTMRAAHALAVEPFDLIIVEYWQMYPLLKVFARERTVLLTHDIDVRVNAARARIETGARERLRNATTARLEGKEEVRAYEGAGRVWTLTQEDADGVRALAGRDADVLPFGVPEHAFAASIAPRDSREVLLLGAMSSAFNRDAIVHFVRDIHPALVPIPDVRFTVVGGALPNEIADFARTPGVAITGHAADVAPFLARAACMVVPLRFAGGIRIRILYAMAAGLPVVCSPVAIGGMDLEPGQHVLVAESPAEYRAHIQRILDDPAFARALAARASDRVRDLYGPEQRVQGLRAFVERAMAHGAS